MVSGSTERKLCPPFCNYSLSTLVTNWRSQCMELVLVEGLFPAHLSGEKRTKHWIHLFSLFNIHHEKALRYVLLQKQRLQKELQNLFGSNEKRTRITLGSYDNQS